VLYGDGRLRPMIENSTAHYENVLLTGKIEYAHIQDYLSICDILLSPHGKPPEDERSIGWPGASPTKLFEYMALGKGIVASSLDYIGKALQDGESGLLIPPGDIDALVQGIGYLADHPDEATRMGRNARRMVCEQHTWEQHTHRILERFAALRAAGNS
jgi:glycosyltransferase involved in cell wall biosynthesis